ncbi:MAG: maltotransferase domain-containing protein, partial [Desulfurivibrionaceae bacterium]|nr:maltotransferase domain-containing protein [Desulfurivibrionaceae bacterium]
GHDLLKAVLQYRHGEKQWHELPMTGVAEDLWTATFQVDELGIYRFTITAWIDHFATWQRDLAKKFAANQRVTSELLEGGGRSGAGTRRRMARRRPKTGARSRPRYRLPVLAGPPLRPRTSGMVPAPARRHDQIRRKPPKEIRGYLSALLRLRGVAVPLA